MILYKQMQNVTKQHNIFSCSYFQKDKWAENNLANIANLCHQIQKLFHRDASTELIMEELDCLVGQVVEGSDAAKWCRPDSAVVLKARFCVKYLTFLHFCNILTTFKIHQIIRLLLFIWTNIICMWDIYKINRYL